MEDIRFDLMSEQELVNKLLKKDLFIEDLDYDTQTHRDAAYTFLTYRKNDYIRKLKSEKEVKFLSYAIEKSGGEFFKYLDKEQRCSKYADYYLDYILKNIRKQGDEAVQKINDEDLVVQRSYDEKELLVVTYKTHAGEEVQYFDSGLNIPASIVSSLIVTIKVNDSLDFLSSMDVSVKYIDFYDIRQQLVFAIKTALRDSILNVLKKNGMDFYKSSVDFLHIKDELNNNLKPFFDNNCIEITKLNVLGINLSGDIIDQLEQLYFINSKEKQKHDNEIKYQKDSLELFKNKVEILSKNPVGVGMLTEAEKDKALDRYLVRTGNNIDGYGFDKLYLAKRNEKVIGKKNSMDVDPFFDQKPTNPFIIYAVIASLIFVLSLIGFASSAKLGLILMGVALIINGLIFLAFNGSIKRYKKALAEIEEEQKNIRDSIYENELRERGKM